MIDFFVRGGLAFMLPLLAASLLVVAIAIDRFRHLQRAYVDYDQFVGSVRGRLERGGLRPAIQEASDTPGPVARLWEEGLRMARLPFPLIRERMESVAVQELSRLERRMHWLSITGQLAPLIGILGTVWGMIGSFQVVEGGLALGRGIQGEVLAGGIWQALITTAAGLFVAIPASLVHHLLSQRVAGYVDNLDRSVADLIATLIPLRGEEERRTKARVEVKTDVPA